MLDDQRPNGLMDEMRRRPSVADDIASQGAQRTPKEINVGELVVVVIVVLVTALLIWNGLSSP